MTTEATTPTAIYQSGIFDAARPASASAPLNPFVGLRPFESDESLLFFGRREQTIELLQHLHSARFLAVVGSSGCGKSSLIRAGLIPKLKAGLLVEDRDRWRIATMKPGDGPLGNLAAALFSAFGVEQSAASIGELLDHIRSEGAQAITARVEEWLVEADANILLLVDQFEEIFRFGLRDDDPQQRDEATDFVSIMLALARQRMVPIYVVLTMRSDFLGDCDNFYGLPEAMNRSQYLVPRLTRKQRQEAIEGPARLFGATLAPRLLDRLLNDLGQQKDQLPVMQHALMRTWENWQQTKAGPIDLAHYEAVGTLKDALSRDADRALDGLNSDESRITAKLFQALTDTDSRGRRIRRPAHLSEVVNITGTTRGQMLNVIDRFRSDGRSFLNLSQDRIDDDALIDISHESLIRQWKTLRDWVDREAESRAMYLRLVDAAVRHREGKAKLWGNPDLQLAREWRERQLPNKAWAVRYSPEFETSMAFIDKSLRQRRLTLTLLSLLAALVIGGAVAVYLLNEHYQLKAQQEKQNDAMVRENTRQQAALLQERLKQQAELAEKSERILDIADEFYAGQVVTYPHPVVGDLRIKRWPDGRIEFLDEWIERNIVPVNVPELREIANPVNDEIRFNKYAAESLKAAFKDIKASGLLDRVLTFDYAFVDPTGKAILTLRRSSGPSPHSVGIAFDINNEYNLVGQTPAALGAKGSVRELVPIFERYGFVWGEAGNGAHFELTRLDVPKP
jgi:ABC-type Fe3+/spermidine/putrescine transport system ATPase subunit